MRSLWLKFKRFYLPAPLAFTVKYAFKALLKTCTIKVQGLENFTAKANSGSCLVALWHSRIAMTCEFFQKYLPSQSYTAFLSKSRDGEPIAKLLESYKGAKSIRVAHNTRHQALRNMICFLKSPNKEVILVTPDGPKGPLEKVKPGIITAAKSANVPVIPFGWEADRYWSLNTWDKFRLPKPFATITITFGPALHFSRDIDNDEACNILQEALEEIKKDY